MRRKCTDSLIHWKKIPSTKAFNSAGASARQEKPGCLWTLPPNNTTTLSTSISKQTSLLPATSQLPMTHRKRFSFWKPTQHNPLRPSSSLLILDNIQRTLKISTLLSAIAADFPQYHIAAVTRSVGNSDLYSHHDFDILTLYPLDFEEFLWANAEFALAP